MILKIPTALGTRVQSTSFCRRYLFQALILTSLLFFPFGVTTSVAVPLVDPKPDQKLEWESFEKGKASWYGGRWHGRKTANGERYNQNSMTAAHKRLPFGTKVRVINVSNGRSCVVRINNRGPYTKGRVIDLSIAAAKEIGLYHRGVGSVKLEVVK